MNKDNNSKKLIRSKSGLRIVSVDDNYRSPFLLSEPQWIPDKEAPVCTRCEVKFGFTTRRHHCRRCGYIYCSSCCNQKLELQRMCFIDPVRICTACIEVTIKENRIFDQEMKILTNGATFVLSNISENDGMTSLASYSFQCKLSADHRHLVFEGTKIPSIEITLIDSVNVEWETINGARSVDIKYISEDSEELNSMKLYTTPDLEHRKAGATWIEALKRTMNLIN